MYKAMSRREISWSDSRGQIYEPPNVIIFTIRSCIPRSRNVQFTSINNAGSKLIHMVKVKLSRVMWDSYNLALQKSDLGNFEQAFFIGNLLSKMEEES